ncbi:MAG: type IV pilus assembly protein PilM [Verrucomicrobiaceae bacterium]|nr:type IV pilus assembly protein PilM [Verrucomicrobiaceae bacterium]
MADPKNIIVLNLGSQRVGGAVFARTAGGDLILKRYQIAEMAGDPSVDATRLPQLKVALEELAGKLKLSKGSVWYAVAGHTVFTRFVKLPPVQGDKLEQIVEFEARQNVPFPINEVIWDFELVGEKDAVEPEVVLVAMKADSLNELNDQVEAAGMKGAGVDLAPMALFNAFRYSYPDADEAAVIVDLGARSTNLVFIEGERLFTRNILVGGATVTTAIGKEFGLGFGDAESQKRDHGFVAFGGAVEEHSDPAVAALSKVIRNAMTRLHGEVTRTINYYRSQQGGSPPRRVFLAGGGAALPGVTEFFQEKLKLPVEMFNPLRGVQVDRGVDAAAAGADAHALGELVGLALRGAGSCPVELELVPDAVAVQRDAAKRAPALVMAMLCLFGALGAGIAYFKSAERKVQERIAATEAEQTELKAYADDLRDLDNQLDELKGQAAQLETAIKDRSFWVRLLSELNGKFANDLIWFTVVEPLKGGKSTTPELAKGSGIPEGEAAAAATATPGTAPQTQAAAQPAAFELRLKGLYRKNDAGQQVVYDLAKVLAKSEFFASDKIGENLQTFVKAETGVEEDRYAYKFDMRLPLKQPMEFKPTEVKK